MSVDVAQVCLCKNPINCLSSMNKSARRCVFCTISFLICSRLINVWEHIKLLSWKYVNTAGIISKITMTLSLINSNNDFDFVGWVIKTPCLFYFRSCVKFHYVEETHTIVAFWRWWKLLQNLSTKDNERNLCQDLLPISYNTDSDFKVHALELLVRVRLSFQKFLQTCQTSRNNKKLSKTGFGYD